MRHGTRLCIFAEFYLKIRQIRSFREFFFVNLCYYGSFQSCKILTNSSKGSIISLLKPFFRLVKLSRCFCRAQKSWGRVEQNNLGQTPQGYNVPQTLPSDLRLGQAHVGKRRDRPLPGAALLSSRIFRFAKYNKHRNRQILYPLQKLVFHS